MPCRCLVETSRKILLVHPSLASSNTGIYAFRAIKYRCIIDTPCETQPTYVYALEQSMQMSYKNIPWNIMIYTSLASPNTGVYVFSKTKLTYRLYVSGTIRTRYISGYIFAKIIIESGQMHLQIHYIKWMKSQVSRTDVSPGYITHNQIKSHVSGTDVSLDTSYWNS